jgi:hypothetical protein
MMPVLIMFNTSFVAVPAFILVLPVTASGPETADMRKSALPSASAAEGDTQTSATVVAPNDFT